MSKSRTVTPKMVFGFLYPHTSSGHLPVSDLVAFFKAIQTRLDGGSDGRWTYPLLSHNLYRGHVGAEEIDGFGIQLSAAEALAATIECDRDMLANLGVDISNTRIPLDAPTFELAFSWHFKMLQDAVEMNKLKQEEKEVCSYCWIRVGSTDIGDSWYFRGFNADAFFCDGPPIWLTWRTDKGVGKAFIDRYMIRK